MPSTKTEPVLATPLSKTTASYRLASIDILRAITMVLMIFVNDLWSLKGIPAWLEHVSYEADGMGLADTIFPAFLFIVGMSIPFAIQSRRKKGETTGQIIRHILIRSAALLIMGLFLVNGEYIDEEVTSIHKMVWYSLCCFSFILIWNSYPKSANKRFVQVARLLGAGLLIVLAFIYRSEQNGQITYFSTHWWGILGLIGWAYLASALIVTFSNNNLYGLLLAWGIFCVLSIVHSANYTPSWLTIIPSPISGGTLAGFTMGGVVITRLFQLYRKQASPQKMLILFLILAGLLTVAGFYTRTFWGISKLRATPAWLFLCSAITIVAFVGIYWLTDLRKKAHWFSFIKPAGNNTLLCYLIPYFAYLFMSVPGMNLPEVFLTGEFGLTKSFLFALLCVAITGGLSVVGVRLKL
ncbi:MAG: DUF5009 domain-containing protein [Bacteroidota bacterium]